MGKSVRPMVPIQPPSLRSTFLHSGSLEIYCVQVEKFRLYFTFPLARFFLILRLSGNVKGPGSDDD